MNYENNLILENDGENLIRIQNFTADVYFEDDEKIVAIELKTVKPNSGIFKGEKEKILYAKAGLKNKYPHKEIFYYLGFPFDPLSEVKCEFDKGRFLNYGIDFKKFFDPTEVLLADELWTFLSDEQNTMQAIIDIINSISTPEFMDKYVFINNQANFQKNPEPIRKILKDWFLYRELNVCQNIDLIIEVAKKNKRIYRVLNQSLFNDKGEYRENRANTLFAIIRR